MQSQKLYAVVSTADLERAREWYGKLFGRAPDHTPMSEVHEWYVGDGGLQVVDDAERAGQSMLTVIVDDLESTRADLQSRSLSLGPIAAGDFASTAQIADPDGNLVTFAQPGPGQR